MPRILAVDVGTSSVRAHVFGADLAETEPARRAYADEDDPDRVVALVRDAVDEATKAESFEVVGGSCFGHSLLALDGCGRPLTPILGWRDTRSAGAADALSHRLAAEEVHARTGCHLHHSYWPAKLAWLSEEEPDTFRATHRFVSFCDYL